MSLNLFGNYNDITECSLFVHKVMIGWFLLAPLVIYVGEVAKCLELEAASSISKQWEFLATDEHFPGDIKTKNVVAL